MVFRVVAFAEALSWLGLLIGMYFKWIADAGEGGVKAFGPIHGTVFIVYVVVTLWVSRAFRWDARTTVLGLVSSLPPFCTAVFEVWADRRGQLTPEPAASAAEVPA
ncbi:membrane protein [Luteipulveratus mongoliensis]|uniref:Membrane protein n=2 Tax=Luteipulveratus mongoliensis TaxID=571913 RepID=A0A0K1JJA2_9MICO|nr:membrane protein [Luteipulveratus mongoliensis]